MKSWKSYVQFGSWVFLLFLLIPPLWYSLRTPFGLIDDYSLWVVVQSFNHLSGIIQWFQATWFDANNVFRITNDIYQLGAWTFLGTNSSLHHVLPWLLKAIVIWSTFNILRVIDTSKGAISRFSFWIFCAIFIFFPNNPEARLGPAELLTVSFLALLLNELAHLFVGVSGDLAKISLKRYLWILFVFTGVIWSKEPNIVLGIVTLGILGILNLRRWVRFLPFVIILLITAIRVWAKKQVGGYGVSPITGDLIHSNIVWFTKSLFLCETSMICTLLLAVPSLLGLGYLVIQTWKTRLKEIKGLHGLVFWIENEPVLVFKWLVFLNTMAFYAIVLISWTTASRYYYPLVYLLTLWIGLTLLAIEKFSSYRRMGVIGILVATSIYFIGANYYNFVYQFACQYYQRIVEQDVLRTTDQLLKDGRIVTLTIDSEYESNIKRYFNEYLPYYKHTDYRIIVGPPLTDHSDVCYYITHFMQPPPAGTNWYHLFYYRHVSKILWWADQLSSWLQFGRSAYFEPDAGAQSIGRHGEDINNWYMYNCHDIWGYS